MVIALESLYILYVVRSKEKVIMESLDVLTLEREKILTSLGLGWRVGAKRSASRPLVILLSRVT